MSYLQISTTSFFYVVKKFFFNRLTTMYAKYLTCLTPFRCAPGYYGNPLLNGSTCKKCDCSGNSDPNLIFEDCDEVTGQCRNCLRNTTGFKCERCAPGYYGDARTAKNCAGTGPHILGQRAGQHALCQ